MSQDKSEAVSHEHDLRETDSDPENVVASQAKVIAALTASNQDLIVNSQQLTITNQQLKLEKQQLSLDKLQLQEKLIIKDELLAFKDKLLTADQSAIAAHKKAGERRLEHILYLESERINPNPDDFEAASEYEKLYEPARRTQIEQHKQDLIEADLATAMANLALANDETKLAVVEKKCCERDIKPLDKRIESL
ncbi:hypothetical protein PtrV1_05365 [Pyrenophora tritici-repentis]|uniref:Uncharacterized protein n=1 Tax=Pyrenophora tritici-repentis TaxID=45151 RepID=A0A2W1EEL3_9PLEO|nr:hypothetical protein PtrV1_05365 [Pyrenophora tritici-repentis]KAF7450107.1 hypothetical protein A1F99_047230 [Pyrenophora tritici-repentis]KAF7572678.1 hypothetical protein PtrM4_075830 [Pyrenophora tritici-repentis]KAI1539820.1 hypothetical protein PtrSN001C_005185 [Pyrenophora tritici-repentis]KAI1570612.1 hypothetical protein PtrEW4_005255 [Pyrenophora tritici-repentis]